MISVSHNPAYQPWRGHISIKKQKAKISKYRIGFTQINICLGNTDFILILLIQIISDLNLKLLAE